MSILSSLLRADAPQGKVSHKTGLPHQVSPDQIFKEVMIDQMITPQGKAPQSPEKEGKGSKNGGGHKYRAVFISDTHLGTKAARVDLLLDFLKSVRCEQLYLVGDIVDGWQIKRSWYWDTLHNDVIRRVLKMAKHGVQVVYIPGNHDEGLRGFEGHDLAGVSLAHEVIFEGATGKKYWVLHGDQFDGVVKYARWLAHIGDRAYGLLLRLNTSLNWARRVLGYDYWSLSAYLKHKVKNAVEYIGKFEEAVAAEAKRRGVDGVICGHIHHAECRTFDGVDYMNDGDWVESCTALVEHEDGRFEILYWADEVARRDADLPPSEKRRKRAKANKKTPTRTPGGTPETETPETETPETEIPGVKTPPVPVAAE